MNARKILKKLFKKLPNPLKFRLTRLVGQPALILNVLKQHFIYKGLQGYQLFFDNSTICTANCIFCAYQFDVREKGIATLDHFKRTIEQFVNLGGKKLDLTPLTGEVFVSNSIIEQIEYALSLGIKKISFFTNATLLHKVNLKELLTIGVDEIAISVSPLRDDLYKSIYRSDSYKRVLNNISNLLKTAKECNSSTTISLEYRGNLSLRECNSLEDFNLYCRPYLTEKIKFNSMQTFDTWSGRINDSDLLDGMKTIKIKNIAPLAPCPRLWNIHVEPSGDVNLCGCRTNYDYGEKSPLKIGNLNESSLQEILNSKSVNKLRKSFLTGKINPICANCSWYGN